MKKRYRGQTLVGLIIALSLSALLLLTASGFYAQVQHQNRAILQRLQLQSELQRMLQLMAKDLRRAGFRALSDKALDSNVPLFEQENGGSVVIAQADGQPPNSCVLFFYDLNANGCIGEKYDKNHCIAGNQNAAKNIGTELFSYKVERRQLKTKTTYKSAVNSRCVLAECRTYLQQPACNAGSGWADLLDKNEIEISLLRFDWLIENQAVQIHLKGNLKQVKKIEYETSAVVPLMNAE